MRGLTLFLAWVVLTSCNAQVNSTKPATNDEWKEKLTAEQYYVLRENGTERAFTGKFNKHKEKGVYTCAGCGQNLFSSKCKFDSGTGWPSYYDFIKGSIDTTIEGVGWNKRTEVHCSNCKGHLGHVFKDGPAPTGLRYCINSVALGFTPE